MDKQTQRMVRIRRTKILMWLGLLIFFGYSFQAIMDLEEIGNSHRQLAIVRIFRALSSPNLFEYEYETQETSVILEKSCQNSADFSQVEQVGDRTVAIALECPREHRTIYTFRGSGFRPNTAGYIVWRANIDSKNQKSHSSDFMTDIEGSFLVKFAYVDLEDVSGQRTITVVEQLSGTIRGFSDTSQRVAAHMWETFQIAFLATMMSALLAFPFTLLSARPSSYWGRGFNLLLQPLLAVIRSVHPLITVIFAIITVGIGPTAGVLALALFSTAVLIDKFSEYARVHASLSWRSMLTTYFPGIAFRHFPTNLVIATVLGFMGGGGIGFSLQQDINLLNYSAVSVSLLAIILTVGSLDLLSRAIWHKIQPTETSQPLPEKEEIPVRI